MKLTAQPLVLLSPRSSKFVSSASDLERSRDGTQCSSSSRGDESPTSRKDNRSMSTAKRITFTKLCPKSLERLEDLQNEDAIPDRTTIQSCVLEVPRTNFSISGAQDQDFDQYFRSNEIGQVQAPFEVVTTHKRQQVKLKTTRPIQSYGDLEENPNQTFDFASKVLTTDHDFVTKNSLLPSHYSGYSGQAN